MKSAIRLFVFSLIAVVLLGCASKPAPRNIEWQPGVVAPKTIALVPVRNLTAHQDGVALIEKIVPEALSKKGYEIADTEGAKAALAAAGISSVDQVWKTPVSRLGSAINADGLMFVAIEKWQKQYELTDTDARVSLLFLLYSKSGKKLWSWRQEIYKRPGTGYADSTGDPVADILLAIAGGIVAHNLTSMDRLAVEAMDHALNTGKNPLPNYR